jgi:transposase
MKRRDARSLDHVTLEEMRRLAVSRVQGGEKIRDVGESLQIHPNTVSKWMAAFRAEGAAGIARSTGGGRPGKLDAKQRARLLRVIVGKNPQQLNFGPALWTLSLVRELIERLFDVVLDMSNVWRLLRRMGLTPQQPTRRAFQRDDAACRQWMTEAFPDIVRSSRKRQSTLLFLDETGIHEDHAVGTTWGPRGERPVVRVTGTRRRLNVISAISPRGRLWFRCFTGNLNAPLFLEFLRALRADLRKPVDLVLDRHPAHIASSVTRFIKEQAPWLRIHFLPSYAPDLNPDEHVWSYVKGSFRRNPVHAEENFEDAVETTMTTLECAPDLVRTFFDHPAVQYVKDALKW